MNKENSMSNLIRSQCSLSGHSGGSIMLNIIIMILIFTAIISAVVYMSSSSMRQAVSSNQSANAWNLAEAGYRFLAISYLKTPDVNGNGADDEKAAFLRSFKGVNDLGLTYVIPNNGSFTLTIRPYWFYNAGATTTGTNISVQLPGTTPANFTMPASGWVKVGDSPGVGIKSYTGGVFTSGTGAFACTLASITMLNPGDSVYLVLYPSANQTLTPGSTLTLNLNTFSTSVAAFPARDGLIEINPDPNNPPRLYRYSRATLDPGNVLKLTNLQHSDKSTFSTPVTSATTVTFKKYITAQSRGKVGEEERTLSFNQAITDSVSSAPPVVVKLDTAAGLSANFSQSSSIASYEVQTLQTSGGGSAAFSIIDSLTTTGSGANAYQCGAFWYKDTSGTDMINKQWAASGKLLSYDVQVKAASGNSLTNGTLGLAIRAQQVSSTEPNVYFGLTFMKYDLPNLYFNRQTGTTAINPGDTVVGATSGATGIVQGTPEITSGSWAGGNAAGKIRFASVTGTFSTDEYLKVGGVNRAQVNGSNYFACSLPPCTASSTDYIPQTIKPKPSDFSPARYNIGPLLLVLWERKSDGTFRWLAYKDISNITNGDDDYYVRGLQDWVEPTGSCTNPPSSCNGSDGQIINDMASIYVRVQEKRVVLGSGAAVKVNDINLFYGDTTSRYIPPTWPARPGNAVAYDIKELRRNYAISDNFVNVIWVPQYISQWEQSVDFLSHIESGTPPGSASQFQWDAVNPSAAANIISTGGVLMICPNSSNPNDANCNSATNGTLRLTELVTPDSGTYSQPEVGAIGCGNFTTSPYSTAGFTEFAFKISSGGSTTGGFSGGSLSW